MKRIERNTYNSLRKSITADTICVEIPTEYTKEGRQGIHEMLTIEKHMRASSILWNDIEKCYCIHYVPVVDEYTEEIRKQQEAQDIDRIMETLPKSDMTWNGFQKPTEDTTEAQTTETTAPAEEQTTEPETEEEETETPATPGEMIKVRNVIMSRGGYRERELLKAPHTITHGETWNDAHKVVNILATTPDPDGYRPGCAVDIVARAIVG